MKAQVAGKFALVVLLCTLGGTTAQGAGFEKNIMWGARWAGVGGAAVAASTGADALYFNPAGLASGGIGQEISANFSPTFAQYEGAFVANTQVDSKTTFSPIYGLIYGARINDKFGFGIGSYVSAGSNSEYDNVSLNPAFAVAPTIKSNIRLIELALGAGYQVMENLRLGAAYRIGFVTGDFSTTGVLNPANPATTFIAQLDNLDDQQFNGFKVGAQYKPLETLGLGFMLRTPFDFDLEGDLSAQLLANGTTLQTAGGRASSTLPLQWALSGYYDLVPNVWRGYLEYVFTKYGENETLDLDGRVGAVAPTTELTDIVLSWKDQHNVRIAGEYTGTMWPIRFGYVWTSQVVPDHRARPTFSSPGQGHSLSVGTGQKFLEDKLDFNIAGEYSWINGEVGPGLPAAQGDYSTMGYALHLGAAYNF